MAAVPKTRFLKNLLFCHTMCILDTSSRLFAHQLRLFFNPDDLYRAEILSFTGTTFQFAKSEPSEVLPLSRNFSIIWLKVSSGFCSNNKGHVSEHVPQLV
jgi:hypothetical protein